MFQRREGKRDALERVTGAAGGALRAHGGVLARLGGEAKCWKGEVVILRTECCVKTHFGHRPSKTRPGGYRHAVFRIMTDSASVSVTRTVSCGSADNR